MSPTHLDQPFKGRLCAKVGLERPLVSTQSLHGLAQSRPSPRRGKILG